MKKQDEDVEALINVIKSVRHEGETMNTTLKVQDKHITKLGERTEQTEMNMVETDGKMKHLLEKANHCWLWFIIVIEAMIMILILIL